MIRTIVAVCVLALGFTSGISAQLIVPAGDQSAFLVPSIPVPINSAYSEWVNNELADGTGVYQPYEPYRWQEQASGQDDANGGAAGGEGFDGGASGAAAATDPSQPLAQLQFQNVFIPETYFASHYSHHFIVQPVIPIHLNSHFFPYHVIRPTLPIIAPAPTLDGQPANPGGLGDLTMIDIYVHPIEHLKTNVGVGPVFIFPTSTDTRLGRGEWHLGPAVFAITTAKPKWIIGALVQVPFSLNSNAYQVQAQPILNRLLPDDWYAGVGDLLWRFDDQDGGYNIPLSFRIGKVVTAGKQPINIFVQPQWTPQGLHTGADTIYGIKLSITFLMPGAKFGYQGEHPTRGCHRGCLGCRHCQ